MPLGYDADSTAFTEVRYRALGQDWQPGFPAARLAIGEFWGSLFQLVTATGYELEVSLVDSFPVFEKVILTAATTTLAVPNVQSSGNLKWVSPNGIGSVYSETSPGNLQTLFASGLPCGTTVLMKGGNYTLDNLNANSTQIALKPSQSLSWLHQANHLFSTAAPMSNTPGLKVLEIPVFGGLTCPPTSNSTPFALWMAKECTLMLS
ncbi:MAG: hypothetical protein IPJ13_16240 [Saprospiraceae bacterium]|nr:hypothetical protein [Saprospiraceae bacterium]